jgi:hypothetical protein
LRPTWNRSTTTTNTWPYCAGRLNDSQFGRRQRGTGNVADIIADTFRVWSAKLGSPDDSPPLNRQAFRSPRPPSGQLRLFEG